MSGSTELEMTSSELENVRYDCRNERAQNDTEKLTCISFDISGIQSYSTEVSTKYDRVALRILILKICSCYISLHLIPDLEITINA